MINNYATKAAYAKNNDLLEINIKPSFDSRSAQSRPSEVRHPAAAQTQTVVNTLARRLLIARRDDGYHKLITKLQTVSFSSGEVICRPHDNHDYIYFPETVVCSQMNFLEDGRTVETAMIGSEGIIGLSSVLGLRSTNLWTQVSIAGEALKIPIDVFREEFMQGGGLQKFFLEYVNSFIRQISQRAVCNNHHRINERFSTWLLMLDDRISQREKHKLSLTQEQIAQFLGVHRPSVTGIAQELRDQGIIDYLRGRIFILDRAKLRSTACECYSAIN